MSRKGWLRFWGIFLLLGAPALAALGRAPDNDLWFLLAHGRYVLTQGFPHLEPFSLHQGLDFVMQQWLSGVLFQLIHEAAGLIGLALLAAFSAALSAWLFYRLAMGASKGDFLLSLLLTLLFSRMISPVMVTRPYLFTVPILLILLLCLEGWVRKGSWHSLAPLPLLSLLLANLQASMWPLLFLFILPYLAEQILPPRLGPFRRGRKDPLPLLLALFLMLLAGLANPYGVESMLYLPLSYGLPGLEQIQEMKPPFIRHAFGALTLLVLPAMAFLYGRKAREGFPWRYAFLTLGTGLLALANLRGIAFLAVGGLFPAAFLLRQAREKRSWQRLLTEKQQASLPLVFPLFAAALLALFAGGVLTGEGPLGRNIPTDPGLSAIVKELGEEEGKEGFRVYTGFWEGSLALYHGLPVYLDPRAEVYFKARNGRKDIFREYLSLRSGALPGDSFLAAYDFTHLIIKEGELLQKVLEKDSSYRLVRKEGAYSLYEAVSL